MSNYEMAIALGEAHRLIRDEAARTGALSEESISTALAAMELCACELGLRWLDDFQAARERETAEKPALRRWRRMGAAA